MSSAEAKLFTLLGHPTEPVYGGPMLYSGGVPLASRSGGTLGRESWKSFFKLRKDEHFSVFRIHHAQMASELIGELLESPTIEDFANLAEKYRNDLNDDLYHYALHVALTHRKDAKHVRLPSIMAVFPERFITAGDWAKCQQVFRDENTSEEIVDLTDVYTGTNLNSEHCLAYYREDPGVNLHHYHWHVAYPGRTIQGIPKKDRQGELFYYMHQQMISRYNFERLSNNMSRVKKLVNWHEPIEEGYFPRLPTTKNGAAWMPRQAKTRLRSILTDDGQLDIVDLEHWRSRIFEAIHSKSAVLENSPQSRVPLDNTKGIDILGCLVESTDGTLNTLLYGSLHNCGHDFLASCHDPDGSLSSIPKDETTVLNQQGVMGSVSTACRDPVFYRWHAFIDDIFQEHKNSLKPYPESELKFDEVYVNSVEIETDEKTQPNEFHTFWDRSLIDIEQGIDFAPKKKGVNQVRFKHLNHKAFTYKIKVTNDGTGKKRVSVRIFLAPLHDDRGLKFLWNDQRTFYIELDRFVQELSPKENTIMRKSTESSVTAPFEQQFRAKPESSESLDGYCTCGWPQHLLIPKGCAEGLQAQLFVMITDFEQDKVAESACSKQGLSYCGVMNEKYPDKRPMGFPFDRKMAGKVTVEDVVENYPNMSVTDVKIIFNPEGSH